MWFCSPPSIEQLLTVFSVYPSYYLWWEHNPPQSMEQLQFLVFIPVIVCDIVIPLAAIVGAATVFGVYPSHYLRENARPTFWVKLPALEPILTRTRATSLLFRVLCVLFTARDNEFAMFTVTGHAPPMFMTCYTLLLLSPTTTVSPTVISIPVVWPE